MRICRSSAFSLIEVVIAVGIFAVAVVTLLALLPSLTRQSTESADALTAQQLPDNLRIELQRLAGADFDALAAAIPVMTSPLDRGLLLVASRDGARLHAVDYRPPDASAQLARDAQYFAIEVWRFKSAPLAYDAGGAVLPLYARVSGPYRIPGAAAPTTLADRSRFTFTLAINR
jgi:hypothetical protein